MGIFKRKKNKEKYTNEKALEILKKLALIFCTLAHHLRVSVLPSKLVLSLISSITSVVLLIEKEHNVCL